MRTHARDVSVGESSALMGEDERLVLLDAVLQDPTSYHVFTYNNHYFLLNRLKM